MHHDRQLVKIVGYFALSAFLYLHTFSDIHKIQPLSPMRLSAESTADAQQVRPPAAVWYLHPFF